MYTINITAQKKVDIAARIMLYLGIGLLIASFVQKGRLPPKLEILNELYQEPIQYKTYYPTFQVMMEGLDYEVSPLYKYELYGLVVSQHNSSTWWDYYHKKWGDALNLKDICVIWGDNLQDETYRRMRFRNGSWTCYIAVNAATADEDWSKFNLAALSNNHLLSNDPSINQNLRTLEVGDQIYLSGYLSSYRRLDSSFNRGTSISRTDEGEGACETIYLKDFKILKKANLSWRALYRLSQYLVVIMFILVVALRIKSPLGG